jgi:hypothetical protein
LDGVVRQHVPGRHRISIDHRLFRLQPDNPCPCLIRLIAANQNCGRPREGQAIIGRIIWGAALATIALLTTALQLDMQTKKAPGLAAIVPAPLRNQPQSQIV